MLDLDGHGRVGTLHVGGGADDQIEVPAIATGGFERLAACIDGDFGHQRELVVGTRNQTRTHALGIEHAFLVDHVALADARSLLDEGRIGFRQGRLFAGHNGSRMLSVVGLGICVVGRDQFVIGDGVGSDPEAAAAQDDRMHDGQEEVAENRTIVRCRAARAQTGKRG